MLAELHNMSCYCFRATDGWSQRRFLIVTGNKIKAREYMEDLCKRFTNKDEKWSYEESDIMDSSFLNGMVII